MRPSSCGFRVSSRCTKLAVYACGTSTGRGSKVVGEQDDQTKNKIKHVHSALQGTSDSALFHASLTTGSPRAAAAGRR